jgi:hypothetical protein
MGGTPLSRRVNLGEHTFMLRKRGFVQRSIHVNPSSPNHTVDLARAAPRPRPVDSSDLEDQTESRGAIHK